MIEDNETFVEAKRIASLGGVDLYLIYGGIIKGVVLCMDSNFPSGGKVVSIRLSHDEINNLIAVLTGLVSEAGEEGIS